MLSLSLRGSGWVALLGILVSSVPSWAEAPATQTSPLSPEAAISAALDVHPLVRAAEAKLLAARGVRSQSSLFLNNPQLSGASTLDGTRGSAEISQPLSFSGEGWFARRAAGSLVDANEAALARAQLVVAADVRQAYVDAVVSSGTTQVALHGLELAERLRNAVRRQHEEGEASLLDLRLARLSEVKAASRLLGSRAKQAEALRDLSAKIGRPVASVELLDDPLAVAPSTTSSANLERSDVRAAQLRLQSAKAQLSRQRSASLPPVSLGAFAEVEDGGTYIGPSVSLSVPLFNRNQSGRAQANGKLRVAEAQLSATSARADTERVTARVRVAEAKDLSQGLIADPVAEARAALKSIEAGYLAGQIDLPSTVLLQGEVLSGESAAITLLGRVAAARLDLLLATEDTALLRGSQ